MIPKFPKFEKLTVNYKRHIENHTAKHPPYSDFNFTSLLSWGGDDTYISWLNGNLVIKFKDYITHKPFYTFLGVNKVSETVRILLKEASKNGLPSYLKLVPETAIKAAPNLLEQFHIQEDRDNFDYIYIIEDAKEFKGNKHRDKRNFINRFKKFYKSTHKFIDLSNLKIQSEVLNLFNLWQKLKRKKSSEVENELLAIKKVLSFAKDLNLVGIGIYIDNRLVAFSINEILSGGYAMNLFEKADKSYQGIFPYLRHITALYLLDAGSKFLSHEQDLGIEGLRKSKMSYNPHFFLKKYTVSKKQTS